MKNKRRFRILSVVLAVIFSVTIIGGIIVSVLIPKKDTVTASADTVYIPSGTGAVWAQTGEIYIFGEYTFNSTKLGSLKNNSSFYTTALSRSRFLLTAPFFAANGAFSPANDDAGCLTLTVSSSSVQLVYRAVSETTTIVYNSGTVLNSSFMTISLNGYYPTGFKTFIDYTTTKSTDQDSYNKGYNLGFAAGKTEGYVNGYEEGYNEGQSEGYDIGYDEGYEEGYDEGQSDGYYEGYSNGLEDGYSNGYDDAADENYELGYDSGYADGWQDGENRGYENGYSIGSTDGYEYGYGVGYNNGVQKGHSDGLTNPISSFIEPVHKFMNTEFFGSLTYASLFNVILFVAVALIFIKMFSGG